MALEKSPGMTNGARHFIGPDGIAINGGIKVADVYAPARDIFIDWFFGADDTYETLTVNTSNAGLWVEISTLNPFLRGIVVIVESGSGLDYDWTLELSRNGLAADAYTVASGTAVATQITQISLQPGVVGHDLYARLSIRPEVGQTGTQLNFKAYCVGRGG